MVANRALAPTTFWSGPEENLAAVDVYEAKNAGIVNNTPLPLISADKMAEELRGGSSMLGKLAGINPNEFLTPLTGATEWKTVTDPNPLTKLSGSFAGDGKGFLETAKNLGSALYKTLGGVNGIKDLAKGNYGSALQRISNAGGLNAIPGLSGPNSPLSSLSSTLGSNVPPIVGAMLNAPITTKLGTYANVGGLVASRIPNNQLTQSLQMGGLINNLVPGSPQVNVVDKDMTSRLIAAVAVGGMSAGMQGAFTAALPLAAGDSAIIASAGRATLNYAAGTGDIKGFKEVVNTIPSADLAGMGRSAIKTLSSTFSFSSTDTTRSAERMKEAFSDTTEAFTELDKQWLKADVEAYDPKFGNLVNYPILNLSVATEGSRDFKTMMVTGAQSSNDSDLQFMCMADMFAATTPEEELAKSFPMTNTNVTTKTTAAVVEKPTSSDFIINYSSVQEYEDTKDLYVKKGLTGFDS